jgi:hypothetical protein
MKPPQLEQAHRWLHQLVGEWTFESEGPGEKSRGTERVRKLGDVWIVGESQMQMPGGGEAQAIITIGYDPRRKRFVGSWVGSMMTMLWVYDGELDPNGRLLSLYSEGPTFDENGNFSSAKMSRYRDAIELQEDGTRIFTGSVQTEDGAWKTFMTLRYRRSS